MNSRAAVLWAAVAWVGCGGCTASSCVCTAGSPQLSVSLLLLTARTACPSGRLPPIASLAVWQAHRQGCSRRTAFVCGVAIDRLLLVFVGGLLCCCQCWCSLATQLATQSLCLPTAAMTLLPFQHATDSAGTLCFCRCSAGSRSTLMSSACRQHSSPALCVDRTPAHTNPATSAVVRFEGEVQCWRLRAAVCYLLAVVLLVALQLLVMLLSLPPLAAAVHCADRRSSSAARPAHR